MGGATRVLARLDVVEEVSIHAPRGGRDVRNCRTYTATEGFNSRAPWGARHQLSVLKDISAKFQFTRPVGGATLAAEEARQAELVSIHAPRGGRDAA